MKNENICGNAKTNWKCMKSERNAISELLHERLPLGRLFIYLFLCRWSTCLAYCLLGGSLCLWLLIIIIHWGVWLPLPPWPGQLPGQRERSYENCRKIKHLHTKYWCHYWTAAELFANFSGLFSADQTQFFQQTELLRTNSENSEQLSCSMCTQRVRIRAVMYQLAHSLLRHQPWWSSALLDSEE